MMKARQLAPVWAQLAAALALVVLVTGLQGCGGPGRPPIRPRPTLPVVTRVPAPLPYPTVGPDDACACERTAEPEARSSESGDDGAPAAGPATDASARGVLIPPAAPVLLGWPQTFAFTTYEDNCRWMGDVLLKWRHASPPAADYFEVWHGLNQPYSVPEREGTTTALRWLSAAPGQDFVYNSGDYGFPSGCQNVMIAGEVDSWRIKACNRAGCSTLSNEIGVMTFSLRQGMPFPQFGGG